MTFACTVIEYFEGYQLLAQIKVFFSGYRFPQLLAPIPLGRVENHAYRRCGFLGGNCDIYVNVKTILRKGVRMHRFANAYARRQSPIHDIRLSELLFGLHGCGTTLLGNA